MAATYLFSCVRRRSEKSTKAVLTHEILLHRSATAISRVDFHLRWAIIIR